MISSLFLFKSVLLIKEQPIESFDPFLFPHDVHDNDDKNKIDDQAESCKNVSCLPSLFERLEIICD